MARSAKIGAGIWLWPAAVAVMLLGMVVEANMRIQRADADPHHARCKEAIESIPMTLSGPYGTWSGQEVDVPGEAVKLLHPNVILSRKYVRHGLETETVALLIVDCRDAGDLQGHYPPVCYPAEGDKPLWQRARVWHLPDMDIPGIEYHFASAGELGEEKVIYNFFVLPCVPGRTVTHKELDGVVCTDMDSVYVSGEDYQRRYFGASEFQMVTSGQMTEQQRDQAFIDLLTPNEQVIRTLENRVSGGR